MALSSRAETQCSKNEYSKFGYNRKAFFIIFRILCVIIVLSFIFMFSSIFTPKSLNKTNAIPVAKSNIEQTTPVDSIKSTEDFEDSSSFPELVKEYTDVILGAIISIGISLITVSATIFIFSKSALDRINDENEYVADIVKIHKRSNIRILFHLAITSVCITVLSIVWHCFLTFKNEFDDTLFYIGIGLLFVGAVLYIVLFFFFWDSCVRIEQSLRKIVIKRFKQLAFNLEELLPPSQKASRLELIGDWQSWEEDKDYIDEGIKFCKKMSQDQFIDQFLKAERLLSFEETPQEFSPNLINIVTIFQERSYTLFPSLKVEKTDLGEREYVDENGNTERVITCISDFEKKIGFVPEANQDNKYSSFFDSTEKLYRLLNDYNNLLISERYTRLGMTKKKSKVSLLSKEDMNLSKFSEAYYYFFLRILAVFVSSVQIKDYSFNGSSLNYANFYSSKLKRISLYSASFFRTILSRTTLNEVILDLSIFYDIDFYCSKIIDSSFNNSDIAKTQFEHTTVQNGGFNSCLISSSKIIDSDFSDCIFNNSEFMDCNLQDSSFTHSKFRDVKLKNSNIKSCSFQGSTFYGWTSTPLAMTQCDFSESIWTNMDIQSWDLSDGVFIDAILSGIHISGTPMTSSSFIKSSLDSAEIKDCKMYGCTLQYASMFSIILENVDLSMSDLSFVIAVRAKFIENCKLNNTNCADADFSEASFNNAELISARLYNCSLTKSLMDSCVCKYLLADNMQFTFAKCSNSDFSFSSLSHSNLTKSEFIDCIFTGAWLNDLNATETIFQGCTLKGIDFTETRFVKSIFQGHDDKSMIIKNCNFSNCKFEGVSFNNVRFEGCIFDGSVFVECTVKEKQPKFKLTRQRFNKLSDSDCKLVKILAH